MEVTSRAIIFSEKGLMVFYREKVRNGKKICYYAIPGGHVEEGETLEETCIRELKEELNIEIEIVKYLGKKVIDKREEHYFYCKKISGEPILSGEELERNNPDNYYEFRYLPISELDNSKIVALEMIRKALASE